MENNNRILKLEEFQELFQNVFSKMKSQQQFFPKTSYKLSSGHIMILTHLYHVNKCRASDITKYLGITSGGCTVLTDNLLEHQLIKKSKSAKDKRITELTLTLEGEKIVNEIIKDRVNNFVQLLSDISDEELDQMIQVFQKLQRKF
ncbi:MarR family winged helix-turn-helix transcriptional regulator [Psychrobacillus sp. NPDC093180]|uniref:MarR family winged helix-turn-helix transcriptional regulator n=1 Tax=Psychrobacillus sp. NPDC093180 TaxID=3364489 RepID=UPI003809DDCE